MVSKTKTTTAKTKRATNGTPRKAERTAGESWEDTFDMRKLLAIPLLTLAAYCTYAAIIGLNGLSQVFAAPHAVLMLSSFSSIFVGVFSCLAAYMFFKSKPIGKLATTATWIFIAISAWLALAWIASNNPGSNPRKCPGFFGAMQNCADLEFLQAYVLLLNPFSLAVYSLLAIAGISVIVTRLKN